ncbi:KIN17-like protein [Bienertia sinuspersici]
MEKNEILTPKTMADRIKAKGLEKLRWYCEMCQKQCEDEDGFKCHCMSESHQRQMLVFAENSDPIVDGFPEEYQMLLFPNERRTIYFFIIRNLNNTTKIFC